MVKLLKGVNNDLEEEIIPKGAKFTLKLLQSVEDYVNVSGADWTVDADKNDLIKQLIHNYKIKYNDIQGVKTVRNMLFLSETNYQQVSLN